MCLALFTLSSFNKLRIEVLAAPRGAEDPLSDGVLVEHMHRYLRAKFGKRGGVVGLVK